MSKKSSYRKYAVTTIAAAAAVSAVAPVASAAETKDFTDVKPDHEHYDAIMAMAERGIVTGLNDGTGRFNPEGPLFRAQAAVMFARALDLKTPSNVKEVLSVYTDVTEKSDYAEEIAAVTAAGIFGQFGTDKDGNKIKGKFNSWTNINREQMASVLVRAYNLKELDTGDKNVEINLKNVSPTHQASVQTLANLGITKVKEFNPLNNVTRGQFASFLNRSIDTVEAPAEELAVESVSAINAKTLEVKFNKAASLQAKDFSVTKGTVKSNIAEVKIAQDQKSAQIELTSKLTEGEYIVTVVQEGKEALTGSVKVENEKVAGIEVLSDVAPVNAAGDKATAAYKVTNQYGEDVTKLFGTTLVKTPSGVATRVDLKADGSIEFTLDEKAKVGDKVGITLVDGNTGVSATKQLTLSDKAIAAEATFGKLYNKDGKELSQDSEVTKDKFYLPITVKDQYGKEVTNAEKANQELVITNTNPAVVDFDGAANSKIKEVTIDGKDVLALEVSKVELAGKSNILAISKSTGKSTQTSVTVNEGVKINTVSLAAPSEVVTAKKDIYFPLTVTDTKGNEIKTKVALDKINDSLVPSIGKIVEQKDKGLFVQVEHGTNPGQVDVKENTPVTVVVTSGSGKVATQTVTPKAEAVPTVITGLDSEVSTALREGDDVGVNINNTDLIVEDQYGQVIKDKNKLSALTFEVNTPDNNQDNFVVDNKTGNKSVNIKPADNPKKTSEKLTFKLLGVDNEAASAFTQTFTIVKDSEFTSYTVEDISTVYAVKDTGAVPESHQKEIVVKAKTDAGNTVTLKEGTDYTVKSSSNTTVSGNKITAVANDAFANDATTATGSITVTINATGEEFTKQVTFSNVAPKVQKLTVVENDKGDAYIKGDKSVKEVTSTDFNPTQAAAFNLDALYDLVDIVATDQYGKMATVAETDNDNDKGKVKFATNGTASAASTLTLTKVSGDVKFSNNGTEAASVDEMAVGDVFNARINLEGVSATPVKVTVKKASAASTPE